MKQLALSVNKIPVNKQWIYCNGSGVIDDDETNVIQSEPRFSFKTDRITKQIITVDINRNIHNTVIGKKKVVKNICYPWGYTGDYYNMNGNKTEFYKIDDE